MTMRLLRIIIQTRLPAEPTLVLMPIVSFFAFFFFLRSLSPLITSMRSFGLYFSDKPRVSCETEATEQSDQRARRWRNRNWNFARTHATVVLVVTCLNAVRYSLVFDGKETLGAALFMKLAIVPAAVLNVAFHLSYYAASHAGSLDRVFRRAISPTPWTLAPKYGRMAKAIAVVCWIFVAWNLFHYTYQLLPLRCSDTIGWAIACFSDRRGLTGSNVWISRSVTGTERCFHLPVVHQWSSQRPGFDHPQQSAVTASSVCRQNGSYRAAAASHWHLGVSSSNEIRRVLLVLRYNFTHTSIPLVRLPLQQFQTVLVQAYWAALRHLAA